MILLTNASLTRWCTCLEFVQICKFLTPFGMAACLHHMYSFNHIEIALLDQNNACIELFT